MGKPLLCRNPDCEGINNSFLKNVCRHCGHPLRPCPEPPRRSGSGPGRLRRVPSAEWIGPQVNVHELWLQAQPASGAPIDLDLHTFLRYCHLLKRIKVQFERWDGDHFFDACLFFLRGSFGIWAYLNTESDLQLRSTMCGGLRHDREFVTAFQLWLRSAFERTVKEGRSTLDLLVLDEVKSGTGLGHQLNSIEEVLKNWDQVALTVNISYMAVAPPNWKRKELPLAFRKWQKPRGCGQSHLRVQFKCFMGPLIAYDNDRLLGIAQASTSQGYQVIRHEGGVITLSCPRTGPQSSILTLCPSAEQNITIGGVVAAIASAKKGVVCETLKAKIRAYGCPVCQALWRHLST